MTQENYDLTSCPSGHWNTSQESILMGPVSMLITTGVMASSGDVFSVLQCAICGRSGEVKTWTKKADFLTWLTQLLDA